MIKISVLGLSHVFEKCKEMNGIIGLYGWGGGCGMCREGRVRGQGGQSGGNNQHKYMG